VGTSSDVPALRRGLAVLRLLASHAGPMTATAVAGELGLPRSTTYHLLAELAAAGFVTHLPEDRRYGLGVAAFELGSAYLRHDPLERLARPLLRRLVARVGRTAHLGVLHGAETLYLVREQPTRPHTLVTDVGVRLPAQLPRVRPGDAGPAAGRPGGRCSRRRPVSCCAPAAVPPTCLPCAGC
jgi:DNA-binding IclR family transcriptional regulator